ncbi:MAG: UDP-N-acetylmuramoyl-tripeptide--D-alanyl-D-alanine ligase [Clostridia bacterium]|nr:UDP-N-acetylmuramoyl-tripeptide--D-alanyl-D-alanine ligase [Clostridia bacterium]
MNEVVLRMIASAVTACLFCLSTVKLLGALQQSGYKGGVFSAWLKRKDNLYFNRLAVLCLLLALSSAITSICFSFLGLRGALLLSATPFLGIVLLFILADSKYALKVPLKRTARIQRLFVVYLFFTACIAYAFIAFLSVLAKWNGSFLYGLIAYAPYALMPVLMPAILRLANAAEGVFENAWNKKFVKRAGQVLDESQMVRIGIVGSYGKTSVKNILKTVLSEKFTVVETPESYNTPIGIAKTVFSPEFEGKQVFLAEMGARKEGDIAELCALVKPDYALFTGVCKQHIHTFKSIEGVFEEKSKILTYTAKKVVCGEGLKALVKEENAIFADSGYIQDLQLNPSNTSFTLALGEEKIPVCVPLLGNAAAENISLCVRLAKELGMTAEEIARGLEKVQPVPHRLQLLEHNGVYILDDGYNCNPKGAKEGIDALRRFSGRKCAVTPGIVECGVLEEEINGELGKALANANLDKVILVGETLVGAVKKGYFEANGDRERLVIVKTLAEAQAELGAWVQTGDAVLFLNDLPDVY